MRLQGNSLKSVQKKLGQFYMPHDDVSPITTPEDVVLLARRLINHTLGRFSSMENVSIRQILERAGEHDEWQDKEASIIRVALHEVGQDYVDPRHHRDNLEIAIALARAIASGRIDEQDNKAASQFAKERIRRFRHVNDHDIDYPRQKMKLSEHLQFFKNLKNFYPEIIAEYTRIRNMTDVEKRQYSNQFPKNVDELKWNTREALLFEAEKYGMANRDKFDVASLKNMLIGYAFHGHKDEGDLKTLNYDEVVSYLKSRSFNRQSHFDEGCKFIDDLDEK